MSGVHRQPTTCAHLNYRNLFYHDGLKSCCKILKHFGVDVYWGDGSSRSCKLGQPKSKQGQYNNPASTHCDWNFGPGVWSAENQEKTISQNKRRNWRIIFFSSGLQFSTLILDTGCQRLTCRGWRRDARADRSYTADSKARWRRWKCWVGTLWRGARGALRRHQSHSWG